MRTAKTVSTISYNSKEFLDIKLNELIRKHIISDYMYIEHLPESDEKKEHIHLLIKPNTLLDTMYLQEFLTEFDKEKPNKPRKCIDFNLTKDIDDWILYALHYPPYLASKMESREFIYDKEDLHYYDEDTMEYNYTHAFKGSKFAQSNKVLSQLCNSNLAPIDLINNGAVPLALATQLNAYMFMKANYNSCVRNGHDGHE